MKCVINPKFQHLSSFIENIEEHFQKSNDILYDERNQIKSISFEGEDYVVKSFKVPNALNRFAYRYLRPSKAKRSYEYSLKIGGEFCPEPIAFIEEIKNGLLGKSYFISKYFGYDFTIRPILLDKDFDEELRKKVLVGLADFAFKLHEKGILHRDFSYGNILIKYQGDQLIFNIIDVNRMQFSDLTIEERMESFARLHADDRAMGLIISQYSQHVQQSTDMLLSLALKYRNDFQAKKDLKKKLRGRS